MCVYDAFGLVTCDAKKHTTKSRIQNFGCTEIDTVFSRARDTISPARVTISLARVTISPARVVIGPARVTISPLLSPVWNY